MTRLSRRSLLRAAALSPVASLPAFAAHSLSSIGVQLYTVRNVILNDPAATLNAIAALGYHEAEVIGDTIPKIWTALQASNLKPVSMHADTAIFFPGKEKELDDAIALAKSHGFEYIVFPYLPPNQRGDAAVYHKLAQTLNAAGRKVSAAGLHFCYHNHAFEFQPMDGTMPLEIMMKETDPALVSLEMDVFWVSVAGHNPVEMLHKYSKRVALLHLKDKAQGFPVQYNENVPPSTFREVGHGSLDFPAILKAAQSTRVKHYFVEQDQTPGDPISSLRQSIDYLRALKF